MQTDFDAVIIGAGPAGSSAAILLARAGWSVALVEKNRFPRRKVCGECVAASNLPLLEELGIGSAFRVGAGAELRQLALLRGHSQVVADLPAGRDSRYRWGRALGRETLDTLLLEQARAAGAKLLQPWSVQALHGAAGDWRCEVRALDSAMTRTLRAPLAIDAHGSWEALPWDRQSRRQTRSASDLFAFKANFRDVALDAGRLPVLSLNGGYGGMVLADGGIATVACCIRSDRLDALRRAAPGLRAGDVVEAWLKRECAGLRAALQPASREGSWLAAGPLDPGIRLRADDAVLRIGNAAGEAHPIIGEGMSMALQSARMLCALLLKERARLHSPDAVWQRQLAGLYAAQWRHRFGPRLRLAAVFAHVAMRSTPAALLMALAGRWPGLLTLGAQWAGKVRCAAEPPMARYPESA